VKLLIYCSTLDLQYRMGCTPAWWQLFKALHETGNEVIVVPYLGDPIESPWWRTYPNPCTIESKVYNSYLDYRKRRGTHRPARNGRNLSTMIIQRHLKPKVQTQVLEILKREGDVDAVLFMNVPLNHIGGIASAIRAEFGIPVGYYDADMPIILPQYAQDSVYKFDYYIGADLTEYDLFLSNSKGVIPDLERLGARNVTPLYFAADPQLFAPLSCEKSIDISFFGYGSEFREQWMQEMITIPSTAMPTADFTVGGKGFKVDLGAARLIGDLSYSAFREFCCKSRICLNITRTTHSTVYASSSARPFELAAYGATIVCGPYNGIEEWFEVGKELVMINNAKEACEAYRWLLDDDEERQRLGERARSRILSDHTYQRRAEQLIAALQVAS